MVLRMFSIWSALPSVSALSASDFACRTRCLIVMMRVMTAEVTMAMMSSTMR